MKALPRTPRRTLLPGTRALVIDANRHDAWGLAVMLRRLGFRARFENECQQPPSFKPMDEFDWLFCDVTDEKGIDTIRSVHRERPRTHVVALVRGGRVEHLANAVSALEQGADDFLVKPIQTESVALMVLAARPFHAW